MSETKDKAQLELSINNSQAINALGKLEMEALDLKQTIKGLKKDTDEWINSNKRLDEVEVKMKSLRTELGMQGMTYKQLTAMQRDLIVKMNTQTTSGTDTYNKLKLKLQEVNRELSRQREAVKGSEGVWAKLKKEVGTFGMMAAGYLGFEAITGKIGSIIQNNAKLSDSLADIRKTTGMTNAEVKELNASLSKLNTRTATEELRKIAIVGGQFGIAKNQILDFTTAIDKSVVALGDEFGGGAEEVSKVLSGLRNVFTDIKQENVGDNLLKIGNAINVLGAEGAATGPVISDFANRIGGVGITLGLSSDEVLGLSATLQELNVTAERGGTAVVKILQKMTTDTTTFAQIAGMEVGAFEKMLNEDLYGAFKKVLEGSQQSATSATAFAAVLKDAELQGAGASEIFAKLGANTGMLDDKVKLANGSLTNTNSIMDEFAIKNETLGAKLEKIQKAIAGAFANSSITKTLEIYAGWLADILDKSEKLSTTMETERKNVNMLVLEMTNANTTAQRRKDIYDELNKIAPTVLEGINKESISYVRLRENLEKYNKEQINRIVIQKQQEKLDEQNEITAGKLERLMAQEQSMMKLLTDLSTKNNALKKEAIKINNDENLTLEQKTEKLTELARLLVENNKTQQSSVGTNLGSVTVLTKEQQTYQSLLATLAAYRIEKKALNIEEQNGVDIANEKRKIEELLGMGSNNLSGLESRKEFSSTDKATALSDAEIEAILNPNSKKTETDTGDGKKDDSAERRQKEYDEIIAGYANINSEISRLNTDRETITQTQYEKDVAKLNEHYQVLTDRTIAYQQEVFDSDLLTNDQKRELTLQFYTEMDTIEAERKEALLLLDEAEKAKFFEDKKIFQEQLDSLNRTAQEQEILEMELYYQKLIDTATQFNIDATTLEFRKTEAIYAINEKFRIRELQKETERQNAIKQAIRDEGMARRAAAGEFIDLIAETYGNISDDEESYAQFKKGATLFQIAIDTASAIASLTAASEANPTNAITFGGAGVAQFLSGMIRIGTNFAKAGALLSKPEPKAPGYEDGGFTGQYGNSSPYFSKPTSTSELVWVNEAGPEHITPNWMVENPKYQPIIQYLESERVKGYVDGGFTSTPAPTFTESNSSSPAPQRGVDDKTNQELIKSINMLNARLNQPIQAVFDYDYFQQSIVDINTIKSAK